MATKQNKRTPEPHPYTRLPFVFDPPNKRGEPYRLRDFWHVSPNGTTTRNASCCEARGQGSRQARGQAQRRRRQPSREGLTMPQHIWHEVGPARFCEDCAAQQFFDARCREWLPPVYPICPGDDDDENDRRGPRRKPKAPSGGGERIRELECA